MNEGHLGQEICDLGASIHNRGLTHGATGNISARLDDGWLMTPTGSNLGDLDPDRLSRLDGNGVHTGGDAPTKESFLRLAVYGQWANSGTVVHSVLADLDPRDVLPPITAYYVMRVGKLPLVPFYAPGDAKLAQAVGETAQTTTPCCWPITAPWWRGRPRSPPWTRWRNWKKRHVCSCFYKGAEPVTLRRSK